MRVRIINADVMDGLSQLDDESVHCVVTSPPYWGLRDYGVEGQIGLEATPAEFVARMVDVFREVRRVLRNDGVCFVNLGDSYASTTSGTGARGGSFATERSQWQGEATRKEIPAGLKAKDLIGIPWRVALALQDDGWWLRQDIIWCLSGGAWVYARTQKGDMPVMVKDLVRLDPRTVNLWNGEKWTQVLGWGPSNDTSERLELVLRSGERVGCTGGHLWPTQRGNVAARDLQIGDVIRSCTLPEPDGCARPGYLTDDALWLAGLFLAEGSWTEGKAQLALSADEAHWLPRIEAVARHYGGTCTHTLSGNNLAVRLYGSVLNAAINAYVGGTVAIDKHLKPAAWRLPNAALRLIIEGYLHGDAHDDGGNNRWRLGFCRNYALERDLRTAAARLGATLTLNPGVAAYQNGDAPIFRGEWRWDRSGHWNEKARSEIVEIRASRARQFWDIAVEDEPHLFALASGVLTHNCKPNPMPESVTDRCTKAHEYIFHLTKSERYFWDREAIKEVAAYDGPNAPGSIASLYGQGFTRKAADLRRIGAKGNANGFRGGAYCNNTTFDNAEGGKRTQRGNRKQDSHENRRYAGFNDRWDEAEAAGDAGLSRNKRSVWTIATSPFPEAHFATFPPELPEICIKAGTSQKGCCAKCGAPWERVEDVGESHYQQLGKVTGGKLGKTDTDPRNQRSGGGQTRSASGAVPSLKAASRQTIGWQPTCACDAGIVPATVLDPFGGAGTTGLMADRLQRNAILIELNPEYAAMARKRIDGDRGGLLDVMEAAE